MSLISKVFSIILWTAAYVGVALILFNVTLGVGIIAVLFIIASFTGDALTK